MVGGVGGVVGKGDMGGGWLALLLALTGGGKGVAVEEVGCCGGWGGDKGLTETAERSEGGLGGAADIAKEAGDVREARRG